VIERSHGSNFSLDPAPIGGNCLSLVISTMYTPASPLPLKGVVQKYSWGQIGLESAVARLVKHMQPVDEASPYAGTFLPSTKHGAHC